MDDADFDALLRHALAPPERPGDRHFVARVERSVIEADRYRRSRRALLRQFVSEGLALAAVCGAAIFVGQVPAVREALDQAPGLICPAFLALFLFWLLVRGRGSALA